MELEQFLALAYVLCLYKLHWSHISEVDLVNFSKLELLESSKMYYCIIAKTGRRY